MRLTVISHSCVIETNQHFYAALTNLGVLLQLIVPALWKEDIQGQVREAQRLAELEAVWTTAPVWQSGSVPLHAYRLNLRRQFYLFQPDAIYCENESYALSTFQAALSNRLSLRRPFFFRNNQNVKKALPTPFRQAEQFVLREAACANLVSEEAGQRLREKGYKGRMAYMPYGVDCVRYQPQDARELRQAWRHPGFVFGYMGRLIPEKGLSVLLEAFRRFHPEEDLALVICGDGPWREALQAQAEHPSLRGRVYFQGAIAHADAPRFLSALDVLVLPSLTMPHWKEQFGRVLIEAAACGTPVIGSDSGEIPHIIRRLGHGVIVAEGDVEDLYRAMRRLLEQPALVEEMREMGRREVVQQYGQDVLAYRFYQLLGSVIDAQRRGMDAALPNWMDEA
jgi:glycosyltransferase involved in cell wall biosynthesis